VAPGRLSWLEIREMSDDLEGPEITVILRTHSADLAQEIEQVVPAADVSVSDNFVGGSEIAIFVKYGSDVLKAIMGVLGKRAAAVASAKVIVNDEEFRLEGYSAADVEKILGSPAFQKALARHGH
jgi:UTP:GlnB (protein PII) uridylyltransferase